MRVNDGRLFFGEGESFSSVRRGCQLHPENLPGCLPDAPVLGKAAVR